MLNGTKFDLELHAIRTTSKGEFAVIGILYKIGSPDPFFSKLLNDIKSSVDKDIDVGVINPREIKFKSRPYYRYVGSLTTPPCTEGVVLTIVKKVRTVSSEQLSALKGAVHHISKLAPTRSIMDMRKMQGQRRNFVEDKFGYMELWRMKSLLKYLYKDVKGSNCFYTWQ
ncbi:Alpha carbonic anhydrase 4 [Glycine max]|nr:Alpha carbonic anhydrase 4 [Glycine max]